MPSQMGEGLSLMLLGMGTVFVFLLVLVITVQLMSRFAASASKNVAPAHHSPAGVPDEVVAALKIAVHNYRSGRR